ncbi:hypothetical protein [Lysobacter humi (ex Lee et al. 2017)]
MKARIDRVREAFAAALQPGPVALPASVATALRACSAWTDEQLAVELDAYTEEIYSEFQFLRGVAHGSRLTPTQKDNWIAAIRALHVELGNLKRPGARSERQLRVLLRFLGALGTEPRALREAAALSAERFERSALEQLIAGTNVELMRTADSRSHLAAIEHALETGNLETVMQYESLLQPEWDLDVAVALMALYSIDPAACARAIDRAPTVVTGLVALEVLRHDATALALEVSSPVIKLLAFRRWAAADESDTSADDTAEGRVRLMTQAWSSGRGPEWARLMRFPTGQSIYDLPFARALADLGETAWRMLLNEVELSDSDPRAYSMARLLQELASHIPADQQAVLWSAAFERWNEWDYAAIDPSRHYSWVPHTALDYPVALFYATQGAAFCDAEERRLTQSLEEAEDAWHRDVLTLLTARNRTLARLRLVRLGSEIATGNSPAFPPPDPTEPDDYFQLRYSRLGRPGRSAHTS